MENTQPNNKIFVYLMAIFFVVFIGSGIFLLISNKPTTNENAPTTTATIKQENMVFPTSAPTRGYLKLEGEAEVLSLKENKDFVLNVVADSNKENITAFDILVGFDPLAFDFIEAVSLDPAFQVYSFRKDKRLTLTVVKTSQDQNLSVFSGKAVVKLSYKPKKTGDFIFAILSTSDKETTKFVNEKTEVINPKVNEIKVTVN
ncbi:hypothetical protein HZA76_00625 [Candidatus Roizmanbacteria bacterium]|nr:hypothetical protein [Candidatus Roizmanbacteria bacterium]